MKQPRKFTPEYKSKIVIEILREQKSISQIASEEGIHPNQLGRWKREAIESFPLLFKDNNKEVSHIKREYEVKIDELYAEVGKLTTQLTWLKKKSGFATY